MVRDEKKLYQVNKMGYNFIMLFLALNTLHTIISLQNMDVDYSLGTFIMTTILLTMVTFLCAVRLKTYSISWSYVGLVILAIQSIRWLLSPKELQGNLAFFLNMVMLLSILALALACITSLVRAKRREAYIRKVKAS